MLVNIKQLIFFLLGDYEDLYNYFVKLHYFFSKLDQNNTSYNSSFYTQNNGSFDFFNHLQNNEMYIGGSGGEKFAQRFYESYNIFKSFQKGIEVTSTIKFIFV